MQKKLRKDINFNETISSGMLMRLLGTRPSGLTSLEAAKRLTVLDNSQVYVSVMRDGFLRIVGADQIVSGDILVLAASEVTPVAVATIDKAVNLIEANQVVTEATHGVVLDASPNKTQAPKIKIRNTFMVALIALVLFSTVLAVNQFVFMGLAALVVGTIFLTMIKLVNLGNLKVVINAANWHGSQVSRSGGQQVKPVIRVVRKLLVHAGNAEIPQPVLA
ncbi:hypothetical protein [Latilactobacillus graminis]|uniref:Uncharacterized protein n=2 Tax=Latilactobacillus graminis TaxID=60519 RepID=A0AA89KXY1_9LACO|nr:hypothetical protein [Latilactobacillus graminis]KRM23853.1 hypothetical protein FC90_GL001373 [Latilactobacillus graminis DSM 20719]QFP79743.1 hypothetical protein LG542_05575 [Latilactobacillus graminis]